MLKLLMIIVLSIIAYVASFFCPPFLVQYFYLVSGALSLTVVAMTLFMVWSWRIHAFGKAFLLYGLSATMTIINVVSYLNH